MSAGRTIISIAHRLSTIQHSDKIIVLSKGVIIEQGNHQSLTAIEDGFYRRLWEGQVLKPHDQRAQSRPDFADAMEAEKVVRRSRESERRILSSQQQSHNPRTYTSGTFRVFVSILRRNSRYWPAYTILIICSIISGASRATCLKCISSLFSFMMTDKASRCLVSSAGGFIC